VNRFLNAKKKRRDAGEMTPRTWDDYKATCDLIIATFRKGRLLSDLRPQDFERLREKMARKWGPVCLGNEIQRVRTVFKFGYDSGLLDVPMRFGPEFVKPSASVLRLKGDQVKRLREIVWQQRGLRHADIPRALRLNEDQKGKFKTIIDATDKGTRELAKNLQPNVAEGVKKIRQLHKEAAEKLVAALTDEQRQAWKKMTGVPFNLKLDPTYLVAQ
jgi:hypothetical protein